MLRPAPCHRRWLEFCRHRAQPDPVSHFRRYGIQAIYGRHSCSATSKLELLPSAHSPNKKGGSTGECPYEAMETYPLISGSVASA